MSPKGAKLAKAPAQAGARVLFARTNLLTSLILVLPLFILYQLGVALLPNVGNGADLITSRLLHALGARTFLLVNLGLALAFVLAVLVLRRKQQLTLRAFAVVIVESAIYAFAMSVLVTYAISLLGIHPVAMAATPDRGGALTRTALAVGAGVNEELVFRLLMLAPLIWLFEKALGLKKWLAVGAGFLFDAALFSAAHHVIGGEAWALYPFVARLLFGLIFAAIYQGRGFATAVYTHALYDFYVMVLHDG